MPRKKNVPGQLELDLEQEKPTNTKKTEPKKKRTRKPKVPEGYKQVVAYIRTVRNTSIGNLIRVFHVGSNQATEYMEQLIKDGYLLEDGRTTKKKE